MLIGTNLDLSHPLPYRLDLQTDHNARRIETAMSHAALTARYRPQTFAEVAGQDTVKAILSRASLEGKVAPAYLFSGTRGVGKTTLARIFAKALNCRNAPTGEPCNQCDQCRAITSGNAVDVVEIDGASNRGIDDVRRLKEVVGYAAMEGGFKIFIIDEAHMLSREAFNALLKTLEEPPARVTFIMATTEPHKFPATIISRCQHYVFKPLPENGLVAHLSKVLQKEGVEVEENALRLIARRGAGSVRDSMSLLGQVLALGEAKLTEESARNVLGLAGQEAFLKMLDAFRHGDSVSLSLLLREMLDQGLDMGFFLRELAALWRNLFMLRQSGEAALAVVELPEKEARACLETANNFSLQHIHACWQMTLDGQRRVLTSLEPALALELLLLNIAMLPRLLPLEGLGGQSVKISSPKTPSSGSGAAPASPAGNTAPPATPQTNGAGNSRLAQERQTPATTRNNGDGRGDISQLRDVDAIPSYDEPNEQDIQEALSQLQLDEQAPAQIPVQSISQPDEPLDGKPDAPAHAPVFSGPEAEPLADAQTPSLPHLQETTPLPDWKEVLAHCRTKLDSPRLFQLLLRAEPRQEEEKVILVGRDPFSAENLRSEEMRHLLHTVFTELCGRIPEIEIRDSEIQRKSREELKQEILSHPLVREAESILGARTIDYGQLH